MFRYLSEPEFDTVRERATVFEGQTNSAGRTAAGIILGLHGLRCGEVCGLNIGDLDANRGALHVATLKHGEPRDVDLRPRIAAWLARLAIGKPASSPLLRTARDRELHESQLQRAWRRLSFLWLGREVRFHSLRHTAAMRLYAATKDLLLVKRFLGHKSLTATLIYAASLGGLREFMPDLAEAGTFKPMLFAAG